MFIEIQNLTKKYKKEKFWQNTETLNRIGVINYYSRRDRHANTHTCTHTDNAVTLGGKGRGWHYHSKYIEQSSYSYLLSLHWTNRCQVSVIASLTAYKATAVSWRLFVCCILRKELKQSCPLYLIWHFQPPPYVSIPRECFAKISEFLKINWPRAARV